MPNPRRRSSASCLYRPFIRLCVSFAGFFLVLSPPIELSTARAGLVVYNWGPFEGEGYVLPYFVNEPIPFSFNNGALTIGYDPDDLSDSYIEVSAGGITEYAWEDFTVTLVSGQISFVAYDDSGGDAYASFTANPGPLNAQGLPDSLDTLLGQSFTVGASGGFHNQFYIDGGVLPEPPSLFTFGIGAGIVLLVYGRFRGKEHGSKIQEYSVLSCHVGRERQTLLADHHREADRPPSHSARK